jgi:hypothetical protein
LRSFHSRAGAAHQSGAAEVPAMAGRPRACLAQALMLKILAWIVGIVFLIGLLVVIGVIDFVF